MNKRYLFITVFLFFLFFTPITANAKTFYVIIQEGLPLVDESGELCRTDDISAGDIIYRPPNKYEVIKLQKIGYGELDIYCKCLVNKTKEDGAVTIGIHQYYSAEDKGGKIIISELDKKALDGYKSIKKMQIGKLKVVSEWINRKVKNLSELTIKRETYKEEFNDQVLIKKNAFANCKKLKAVNIDYNCCLEKNSFKNVDATIYYDNCTVKYDLKKGYYYNSRKSPSKIKKELKNAGFRKGSIVKIWNGKGTYFAKKYKTIKL